MFATLAQGTRGRSAFLAANSTTGVVGQEDTQFAEDMALEERWECTLTLITMKANKRSRSRTIDVHYHEDEYVSYIDQINYVTQYSASATSLTVDDADKFAEGDLVQHMDSDEVMLVTASNTSTNVLTVIRDFGQSTESWTAKATTIDDNDYLHNLGNAFEQGHDLPTMKSTTPVERINYCQDIRTPVEASEVAIATVLRGPQEWDYQIKKASKEHMQAIERSNWFGKPYRGDKGIYASGTGNTAPTTCGGVNHVIDYYADSANKVDQDALTEFEFMDFLEAGMDKGNRTKLFFCPPSLRWGFDKWGITRQNTFEKTTVLGMKISAWQSSVGDIIIFTHDLFKADASTYYNYGFLLDPENLEWVTFSNIGSTQYRSAGDHTSTGETKKSGEFQTIQCLLLKLPNTHARLRYKTITA